MKQPAIYILVNKQNGTPYTEVTSNLVKRTFEHKNTIASEFATRYKCKNLVYYEMCDTMEVAILREKQLKAGSRKKKLQLIQSMNPTWDDLYESIIG